MNAPSVHWTILTAIVDATQHIVSQDRALVRAIEAPETIEPSAWFERAIAGLLVKAYKRRLRAIIGAMPTWVGNCIFEASESIPDPRAALFGDN